MVARPGPQSPPLPLPPMCAFIVSVKGVINAPQTMKWGFLHQGKAFSVSSLDPRRKGRFDSICIAGITTPHLAFGPKWSYCMSSQTLSLTGPAHLFHTHTTSLSLGKSHPGARWQVSSQVPHWGAVSPSRCLQHRTQHDRVSICCPGVTLLSLETLSDEPEAL